MRSRQLICRFCQQQTFIPTWLTMIIIKISRLKQLVCLKLLSLSKTLSRLSLLTHDRKESSAYNEGEQYQSVVFNRALPSLYQKLDEQES